jgi:hypothetical protein
MFKDITKTDKLINMTEKKKKENTPQQVINLQAKVWT